MANYNDWVSVEGLREGWLANWLITEWETELGAAEPSWLQSDTSAHGLIVVKENDRHTHNVPTAAVALLEYTLVMNCQVRYANINSNTKT